MEKFVLAGHSFGGYIAGNYAVKYHKYVTKLLMLSPIGVRVQEKEETWESRFKKRGTKNGPPAWFRPLMGKAWENRVSPFAIGRIIGQTQCNKMI